MLPPAVNTVVGRTRWKLGMVAVTAMTLGATLLQPASGDAVVPTAAPTDVAARVDSLGFSVELGPEQRVMGPTDQGDNPFFSETRKGKLYGYFGTSRTIEWRSRNNAKLSHPRVIIDRGLPGKFDDCGAWLSGSVQKLTRRHWIAFYHAEGKGPGEDSCDHYGNTTIQRQAMVETTNGGQTWKRPGYPNNVVVTGEGASATRGITNAGSGRTVRVGDYYYMFFKANHGSRPGAPGIHVARAKVGGAPDGVLPGKFFKYYCTPLDVCGFTQPGIGGKSTPIKGLSEKARYIVWNSTLNRWIGFDATGRLGFRVFASEIGVGATDEARQASALLDSDGNPQHWLGSEDVYPLVSTDHDKYVDQWGGDIRNGKSKQLYAYPSIGGLNGQSSTTGANFYVYYMKLFPGDKFTHRYLFRREVTVVPYDTLNRVQLTTYKGHLGKRFSSTEAPKAKSYKRSGAVGYLLSHAGVAGWKQVYDCTRNGDHALYTNKCKTGWKPYRRVGFVHPQKTASATVPVYRCYAKKSHYASSSRGCDGGKREARLGFALRGF